MNPKTITFTLAAVDADGVCASQKPVAAGSLTINGALATGGVATLDVARHIAIASTGDESTKTFTVTGTDRYGSVVTETTLGPNATTKKLTYNFKTITAITIDAAPAGNLTVGTTDEAETQVVPVEYLVDQYSYLGSISSGGSLTYAVQYTLDDPFSALFNENTAVWVDDATGKTGTYSAIITRSVRAVRAKVTSFSSGTLSFTLVTPSF
jgi:hypothetical protein